MNNSPNNDILIESVKYKIKNRLHYPVDGNGNITKFKPWLGDVFSFMYDRIMEKSIFPKKFSGSIDKHFEILKNELHHFQNKEIIEIATGSGDAVKYLHSKNNYIGTDISSGLLKIAAKRLVKNGFNKAEFYIADACSIPFEDNQFDFAICNLSLNFFDDIEKFIAELYRVLQSNAIFYCSIPTKNRLKKDTKIQGDIYLEDELKGFFQKSGFEFLNLGYQNGAVLYFRAICKKKVST